MNKIFRTYELRNTKFWRIKYNLNNDNICGAPKNVFMDYMNFLCESYRDDVPLDHLYREYLDYLYKLYGSNDRINRPYFSIKSFERHLKDMNLLVYLVEDNYKLIKCVCYDTERFLREKKFNEE